MRIPDPGPLGDTFFDASARAIAGALFLNNPADGYVDAVFTLPDHRLAPFALELACLRAIFCLRPEVLSSVQASYGRIGNQPNPAIMFAFSILFSLATPASIEAAHPEASKDRGFFALASSRTLC